MEIERKWMPMAVSVAAAVLFALLGFLQPVATFEAKAVDFMQRLHYQWSGPEAPTEVVLIAIDDRSVDPASSAFSDLWGKGGWLNRDNWVFHIQFQMDFYRPRVLAFDILFFESRYQELSQRGEELARAFQLRSAPVGKSDLYAIESAGNDSMAMLFWDMEDRREAGRAAPLPVLAFTFPQDLRARQRLAGKWTHQAVKDLPARAFLPEGVVNGGGRLPAQEALHLPVEQFLYAPVLLGSVNVPSDTGGVVRRVPMVYRMKFPDGIETYLPGFTLASFLAYRGIAMEDLVPLGEGEPGLRIEPGRDLVLQHEGKTFRVPLDEQGRMMLKTRFRYRDALKFSFSEVTEKGLALEQHSQAPAGERQRAGEIREALEDKLVFVAQASTGGGDIGNFPLEESIPNIMAHLTAVDNLMKSDALRAPDFRTRLASGLVVGLLLGGLWTLWIGRKSPSVFLFLLPLAVPVILFPVVAAGVVVEPLLPTGLAFLLVASFTSHAYLLESRRRDQLTRMFSAAVSPRVLELMERDPGVISLEGQRMEATIFFSDVAGFTSISEKLTPRELSALLNRYLTPMSEIIIGNDGYVDKYEGDAIMAVWGVPFPDADHADKACRSALEQLEKLRLLAAEIREETGIELNVRMGINSGEVSAGNMGSEKKFQYTVMGDAVNLAARLEPVNKEYGTTVVIGEETRARLSPDAFSLRRLDKIVVKGKTRPVCIYELLMPDGGSGRVPSWVADYETGLKALWDRRWDEAEARFAAVLKSRPEDVASQTMLDRLAILRQTDLPDDWDGAYVRETK